nr:MAG TPA: hypothetical protein [Caudoviricetes sp.]
MLIRDCAIALNRQWKRNLFQQIRINALLFANLIGREFRKSKEMNGQSS